MKKTYSSKVSYGLLAILFVVFFAPIVINLSSDGLNTKMGIIAFLVVLLFAFIVHMFFKTEHTIDNKKLKIKSGFFSYKPIDIMEIKQIKKSSNIISAPAASFDRIEIRYGKFDEVIISPKEKYAFAAHLKKINPNISLKLK